MAITMKLTIFQNKFITLLPPIIAFILLTVAIWDFLTDQQLMIPIIALYIILFILTIVLLYLRLNIQLRGNHAVKLFEKSLKGSLHHFKCPKCNSIFAIKKSKINNKKSFVLHCPTCNTKGLILPKPTIIKEKIPQIKSPRSKYQCTQCGERITIWSEGSMHQPKTQILSCPYCGTVNPLNQLSA